MVRSQAADYGFELNEFDPFFNYRATKFIVDNGLDAYFNWHDDMSWHPYGRDVSATSQVMLHITAAMLYQVFGFGSSLYDFTIIFPVVFGSFTAIVIFALVRVVGGTTAGLFAALFFSVSAPIIIRGMIGWFKSEPLGLFYALLGIYLFLSGIKHDKGKTSFVKLIAGGIFLGFGLSAWGGIQFFIIPLGIFFLAIPFIRKDHKFIIWAIPLFTLTLILTALSFERPGFSFVSGYGGFMLIGPAAFLVVSVIIQKFSKENKIRNNLIFLAATIIAGISLILASAVGLPTFRYLNAINPFLTTIDPLTDSVAEHQTTTLDLSFYYASILMIFAGIGIWLLFRNKSSNNNNFIIKNDMTIFALIIGLLGIYISSAFVRLEVYASISVIILSSIGLSIITTEIIRKRPSISNHGKIIKISYLVIIIALLIIPITLPANANWIKGIKAPPTLLNGGSTFNIATNDWPDAMEWIKNNTPKDAVITSWWDYGYWITTLGERKSSADNATLIDWQIKLIAKMLLSSPEEAWKILTSDEPIKGLDADYVLLYLTGQRGNDKEPGIYILHGGGDESKKIWFMRIAGEEESKYLYTDGTSGTDIFWQNTLLGKMFPFSVITYADFQNNQQSDTYRSGFAEIHRLDIKYPSDGNGPLRLVYASPSLYRATAGPISAVLIYEVNKDYKPNQTETVDTSVKTEEIKETPESSIIIQENDQVAVITTVFGDITIQLKEDIAPKTVENFKKLAESGFYDGTIFHRIIPGFVIQGGDPNTISGTPDTWGFGGPGYTISPEFSNISHKKYIVSMARGADINSAGSQFFIVLEDSPSLDGQYTIFGEVVSGQEVVDKIASLETNSLDQPIHPVDARIEKILVFTP